MLPELIIKSDLIKRRVIGDSTSSFWKSILKDLESKNHRLISGPITSYDHDGQPCIEFQYEKDNLSYKEDLIKYDQIMARYESAVKDFQQHLKELKSKKENYSKLESIDNLEEQLLKAKGEITSWKSAWFRQQDATGKMAWEMPNPHYLSGSPSLYLQHQFKIFLQFAEEFLKDRLRK